MPLDQPLLIIETHPVEERLAKLLHRLKRASPEELLFQRPNEPLCDAVAFRGTDKRWTRRHPEKAELGLEVVAHILTAMIMSHLQARGDSSGDGPELLAHPLANRLQGLKAGRSLRRMDADPFERTMIHTDEDRDGSILHRHRAGRIGASPLIGALGRERAVVDPWSHDARHPAGRQEMGLPHKPEDTRLGRTNPLRPQPCPDFAMPFSKKRRGGQHLPDVSREPLVRVRRLRPSLGGLSRRTRHASLLVIERCPTQSPFRTDPNHTIRALCGRRHGVAHRVDLPVAKGAPPRNRWTASRDSSNRIVKSPTKAFSRASSSSRSSATRLF